MSSSSLHRLAVALVVLVFFSDMAAAVVEVVFLLLAVYLLNLKCCHRISIEQTLMQWWSLDVGATVLVAVEHHMMSIS